MSPPTGGQKAPSTGAYSHRHQHLVYLWWRFVGLDKIVADRIGKKGIGFNSDVAQNVKEGESELIAKVVQTCTGLA